MTDWQAIFGAGPGDVGAMSTDRLRAAFLIEALLRPGAARFVYTDVDRMVLGGIVPLGAALTMGDGAPVGTAHFFDAREAGIANLGGPGRIVVDGRDYPLANRDVLYVGRGAAELNFTSDDAGRPPRFYLSSVPAGADHPHRLIPKAEAKPMVLGEARRANARTLRMYIHPEVAPSCLLLMGITDLADGSVWNTMPPHLHERRMEAYLYFDMDEADRVVHLMGRPEATRHLMVADGDAVISPAWSIHMGAGTGPYAFVWAMTGENQAYGDVTPVAVRDLR